MGQDTWLKQTIDKPLFEKLLWSRPENKTRAGRLLIVGGNSHEFSAPAMAYNLSLKAGVGHLTVLLPQSLHSSLGKSIEDAVYLPATAIGSFSREALAELLDYASRTDLTLLAGNFGHNSETAILINSFLEDHKGLTAITGDTLDLLVTTPKLIFDRPETLIVTDFSKLQKLVTNLKHPKALTSNMSLMQLTDFLTELTLAYKLAISTYHEGQIVMAFNGQVSTTAAELNGSTLAMACYASVWWAQNKEQLFAALCCAAYDLLTSS